MITMLKSKIQNIKFGYNLHHRGCDVYKIIIIGKEIYEDKKKFCGSTGFINVHRFDEF